MRWSVRRKGRSCGREGDKSVNDWSARWERKDGGKIN